MKCSQIKPNGIQCGANAIKGSSLCFTHDPAYQDKKREAVIKGGLNRRFFKAYGEAVEITKTKDLKKLLGEAINGVWTGKIPSSQPATAIGFLSRCWMEANDKSKLDVFDRD
ncbi:MAG: hypothetical protein PHE48_00070 [Candidatus Daviesbacteria bacterium]|nr:hypothetical protein [Candidatus Daviesbacteria bacterium]